MDLLKVMKDFFQSQPFLAGIMMVQSFFFVIVHIPLFPNKIIYELTTGVNLLIANGEWWRLITPMFIHSDLTHFLYNSFALVMIVILISPYVNTKELYLLYFISGILANLCSFLLGPITMIHVGSSGAVFGLFGYSLALIYCKILPKYKIQSMLILIAFAIVFTFVQPGINEWSHIGGLVSGFGVGLLLKSNPSR